MRFSIVTLVAAAYTGLASACIQQPVGSNPSGNPISAPLLQVVPAGKPFDITWSPTTPGTVSIVLLRGPSTNVIPIDCLGDNIPNTGKFSWTPSTSLEPDVTGYGLQIIVTGTGQFQYSTQFGISNPNPVVSKSSTASSAAASGKTSSPISSLISSPISSPIKTSVATSLKSITQITSSQVQTPTSVPVSSTQIVTPKNNSTSSVPVSVHSTSKLVSSSSSGKTIQVTTRSNSTVVLPSKTLSVPVTLKTSQSVKAQSSSGTATGAGSSSQRQSPTPSSTLVASTGGAGRLLAQGGVVGLLGIFVAALL